MNGLSAVSQALLWVVVIVQGIVIVALLRQVGSLLLRVGVARPMDQGTGPPVGELAPWLPAEDGVLGPRMRLLAFVSTGCGTCEALAPALTAVAESYRDRISVTVIGREPLELLMRWQRQHGLKAPVVSEPGAFDAYGIDGLPYGYVIDADDHIVNRGGVNHIEHVEALLAPCVGTNREEADPMVEGQESRAVEVRP